MSQYSDLREWFTLEEAVKYLKNFKGEDATEYGLLRLALEGHFRLTVHFAKPVYAVPQKLIPNTMEPLSITSPLINFVVGDEKKELLVDKWETVQLEGHYDLAMIGNEVKEIEREVFRRIKGGEIDLLLNRPGVFVCSDEGLFKLKHPHGRRLPSSSILVVRPAELKKIFPDKSNLPAKTSQKAQMSTKKRSDGLDAEIRNILDSGTPLKVADIWLELTKRCESPGGACLFIEETEKGPVLVWRGAKGNINKMTKEALKKRIAH